MKKIILLSAIIFILFLRLASAEGFLGFNEMNPFKLNEIRSSPLPTISNNYESSNKVGMSNPAAVYCNELGYNYKIVTGDDGGQYGVCIFPDGTSCDEWQFLDGNCGQSYSYCAKNGYTEINNGKGSVCVNKTTNEEVGSVSLLTNLFQKSVKATVTINQTPVSSEQNVSENISPSVAQAATIETTVPSYFDWRSSNGNWTTPVKEQGDCGSCWAFSTAATLESEYKIFTDNKDANPDLSEEYLVSDCLRDNNCCGGDESVAHEFAKNNGIPDDACMPYTDIKCSCDNYACDVSKTCTFCQCDDGAACGINIRNCTNSGGFFTTPATCSNSQCSNRCPNWGNRLMQTDYTKTIIQNSETDDLFRQLIKQEILRTGPITTVMYASDGLLKGATVASPDYVGFFGADGIFGCNESDMENHAITFVGWNDTGQYWIVRNSWGETWLADKPFYDGGYFKLAYGNCSTGFQYAYDEYFDVQTRNNNAGSHDGGDANVETFYSKPVPTNSFPISCISQSAEVLEDEGSYGDDVIGEISTDGNTCRVIADDTLGGFEQKRYVGSVTLSNDCYLSPAQIKWGLWENRSTGVDYDGNNCSTETFYGPECPSGSYPVSCLSENGENYNEGLYGGDDILGISMTSSNGVYSKCMVTDYDVVGAEKNPQHYRRVGTVCLPGVNPNIVWGDWETRDGNNNDGNGARVEIFYGPECPSGSYPVSCLSESANAESEKYYGEDAIVSTTIFDGKCEITALDTRGNAEQKRRVATVCLPNINKPSNGTYSDISNNPPQCPTYDYADYSSANQIRNYTCNRCDVTYDSYITRVAVNDATSGDTGVLNTSNIEVYVDVKNTGSNSQPLNQLLTEVEFWKSDGGSPPAKLQTITTYLSGSQEGNNQHLSGASCSLINGNMNSGNTVTIKCWVPASYFVSTTGNQRILFSINEKYNNILLASASPSLAVKLVCNAPPFDSDGGKNYTVRGVCSEYVAVGTTCQKSNMYKDVSACTPKCNFGDPGCDMRAFSECASLTPTIRGCLADNNCTAGIMEYYVSGAACGSELKKCSDLGPNYFFLDGKCAAFIVNITSPLNSSYYSKTNISLSFNAGGATPTGYSLDYQPIVPITTPITSISKPISSGPHNIIVYAKDSSGNIGSSNDTSFYYCLGDITGSTKFVPDGNVDMRDVGLIASLFNSVSKYDSRADLDDNGMIDMKDIGIVASQFNKNC